MEAESDRRWALVLGCSVGTGAAIARALARGNDLDIVGLHRGHHREAAAALARDVEAAGARCVLIEANAGELETIPKLVDAVRDAVGGEGRIAQAVHGLSGASVGFVLSPRRPEAALHPKQLLKTFDLMAHSFLFWGQALVHARMFAPGAQLLALLNYQDETTPPGFAAIGGSKGALASYVRHMALEFPRHGVRVNALRFGAAATEALARVPNSEVALSNIAAVSPMGRNVEVEDVGQFVSLLAQPGAAFLNGSIIPFDGGETAAYAVAMITPPTPGIP